MLNQTPTTTAPDVDTVFAVLADPERRAIIETLADADGALPTPALVERSASRDDASADPRRFPIRLHHVHLPKLREAGVVARAPDGDGLELTPTGNRVEAVRRESAAILETD